VNKKGLEEILGRMGSSGSGAGPRGLEDILEKDSRVRKAVADLYMALTGVQKPDLAVGMLAEHVAIIVDMINEFKKQK
jgi:hypothetical protein